MSDTIKIHSPHELVTTIPALLGFQPQEDLVALWLRDPDGVLTWTMRVDIDLPSRPGGLSARRGGDGGRGRCGGRGAISLCPSEDGRHDLAENAHGLLLVGCRSI